MDIPIKQSTRPDPVIVLANWFQFGSGERILNACVESRMLLWVVNGCGRVRVNGGWIALEIDEFVFLPWGHEIVYEAANEQPFRVGGVHLIPHYDRSQPVEFAVSHSSSDALARSERRADCYWPELEGIKRGSLVHAPTLRLLSHYIVERFIGSAPTEPPQRHVAQLLVGEITTAIHRQVFPPTKLPEQLQQMLEYSRSHLEGPLTVRMLASVAGCSPASVHRLFKRYLATSPNRWVTELRVAEAQRLLHSSSRPIHQIAAQVGIVDPFHFSKLFKRVVGQSPQVFRRQARLL
jgi:AraC-like DNA-binding protein